MGREQQCPLSSVIALLSDHLDAATGLNEYEITRVSRMVEKLSGIRIPVNKPVIGANVFTQTSGVHADGDRKDNLYCSTLSPERFGRRREYALGKQSGKATTVKTWRNSDWS